MVGAAAKTRWPICVVGAAAKTCWPTCVVGAGATRPACGVGRLRPGRLLFFSGLPSSNVARTGAPPGHPLLVGRTALTGVCTVVPTVASAHVNSTMPKATVAGAATVIDAALVVCAPFMAGAV